MLKLSWQRWKLISLAKFFGNALCGYNLLSSDFWFCILWLHFFVFRFHNVGYFITQNIYKQKEYYHPHPSKKPPISIFVDSTTTLDWKFYDYCTAWYYYLLFSGKGGEWTASKRCCPSQKTSQQKNQLWWWSGRRNWWTLGEGNWCFTVLLPDRTSLPLWTQRITSISFLPMIFTPEPHIKVMRIKEMITN